MCFEKARIGLDRAPVRLHRLINPMLLLRLDALVKNTLCLHPVSRRRFRWQLIMVASRRGAYWRWNRTCVSVDSPRTERLRLRDVGYRRKRRGPGRFLFVVSEQI